MNSTKISNRWLKIMPVLLLPLLGCKKTEEKKDENKPANALTPPQTSSASAQTQKEGDKLVTAIVSSDDPKAVVAAAENPAPAFNPADLLKNPEFIADYLTRSIFLDKTSLGVDEVVDALIIKAKFFVTFAQEDLVKAKLKDVLVKIADSNKQIPVESFREKIKLIAQYAPAIFANGKRAWEGFEVDRQRPRPHHEVNDYWKKFRREPISKYSKGSNSPVQNNPTQGDIPSSFQPNYIPAVQPKVTPQVMPLPPENKPAVSPSPLPQ